MTYIEWGNEFWFPIPYYIVCSPSVPSVKTSGLSTKAGEMYQSTLGGFSGIVRNVGGLHLSPYMEGWPHDGVFGVILFLELRLISLLKDILFIDFPRWARPRSAASLQISPPRSHLEINDVWVWSSLNSVRSSVWAVFRRRQEYFHFEFFLYS